MAPRSCETLSILHQLHHLTGAVSHIHCVKCTRHSSPRSSREINAATALRRAASMTLFAAGAQARPTPRS